MGTVAHILGRVSRVSTVSGRRLRDGPHAVVPAVAESERQHAGLAARARPPADQTSGSVAAAPTATGSLA